MKRTTSCASIPIFACVFAFAQAPKDLKFEVASVKPSRPVLPGQRVYFGPARGGPGTPDPAQITWTYARMKDLLMTAFDAKNYQIIAPAWIGDERFDVVVKVPEGANKEQVRSMWRNLLAERFSLTLHHESREFQVDELTIAKGGPKMKETSDDPAVPPPPGPPQLKDGALLTPGMVSTIFPSPTLRAHTVARAQPISQLAAMLSNNLNRPVLDKTGLTGRYDFTLDYNLNELGAATPPPAQADAGDLLPDLATVVQQQLGLKLVPARAAIDVLIVDKLEKTPTAN
jgi:uncharacterized protein (TIGR03435 family)